jgi:ATP-dependent Zn protease
MWAIDKVDHKKLRIAYHETGHAVMALICRQRIQKTSLKEMDSPRGTDKYLGFTKLEPFEQKIEITINELRRRIMISLGGYASEILVSDGLAKVGGDDLTDAVKWAENMMQSEEFRNFAARLPIPDPGTLDIIENPTIRALIDYMMCDCIEVMAQFKPKIQVIAEELYKREELTGNEISDLFNG